MSNVPSSMLRRNNTNNTLLSSNKRLSMASATRLSMLARSLDRRSILSTPLNRRTTPSSYSTNPTSTGHHGSTATTTNNNNPTTSTSNASIPVTPDNRPLRDRNYQTLIINEIYEFLNMNKFELEMNHPLTSKTLRLPTQKDFIVIFQFLYTKIDPFYKFTKSMDIEIFTILKILDYPYLENITRSQISAVGGSNWPNFLGILYWLVKLNLQLSEIDNDLMIDNLEDELDLIFVDYTKKSYQLFINNNDDMINNDSLINELKGNFETYNHKLLQELGEREKLHHTLNDTYNEKLKEFNEFDMIEKKSKALENDLIKFKAYIETMELRKSKWMNILDKINLEIKNYDEELINLNNEKNQLESKINDKGYNISIIDNLNNERDVMSKNIDLTSFKIRELESYLNEKINELNNVQNNVETLVKNYNNLVYKIQLSNGFEQREVDGQGDGERNYEIKLNINLIDLHNTLKPNDLINKNLKDEKIMLHATRNNLIDIINSHKDQLIKYNELNDALHESIIEQQDVFENLESELSNKKLTHDEIYDNMSNNNNLYLSQFENLERELRSIRINSNQEYIELENNHQNKLIEFEKNNFEILKQKNYLHDNIQKIIEHVINFKISVQSNLEDLELFINNEFEIDSKQFDIEVNNNPDKPTEPITQSHLHDG